MVKPNVNSEVQVPAGTPSGTLFVCVRGTYGKVVSKVTKRPVSLADCACGYWTNKCLNQADASRCEWLMAHSAGKILGVWKIDRSKGDRGWLPSEKVKKTTWPEDSRTDAPSSACFLIPDAEMERRFVNKTVRLGRAYNPLRGYFA